MSVNPAAAAAAAGPNMTAATAEQLIAAEVSALAADAVALTNAVTVGQVVTAQVLPSNGLTDLISILGNRVAAALPPNFVPGDQFTAQVTGFNGPQILLQVLASVDPATISDTPPPGLTSGTTPGSTPEPSVTPTALQAAASGPPLPAGISRSVAPPPAVFVAASVRPAASATPGQPVQLSAPPSAQVIQAPIGVLGDIEARLAAARAGQISVSAPAIQPSPATASGSLGTSSQGLGNAGTSAQAEPPLSGQAQGAAPQAPAAPPAPPPSIAGRFFIPPAITPSARFSDGSGAPVQQSQTPAAPAPAGIAAFREPQQLVRALNLPVTPTNLAAAKLALDTPQRLPAALATLESALPQGNDPRVATLRTLVSFFGKMDPGSSQLAAQISAYVDNVVTGNEAKLSQLLTAQLAVDQQTAAPATTAATSGTAETQVPIAELPALPVVALAQIAERGAALNVDLKTQLLALINAPGSADAAEDLIPAAATALTAITAVQMNAAQAMATSPQTMAFTLPMWLGSGYAQARVAIDRDAPEPHSGRALDGDNFHIAFVLDTKHLGTVTVDLQTVGRAFSLAVKTENEGSAKRFGDALNRLTGRLETLRYRVNSAEATVAARGTPAALAAAAAAAAAAKTNDAAVAQADTADGISTDVNARA
jgi:hypothetical protein